MPRRNQMGVLKVDTIRKDVDGFDVLYEKFDSPLDFERNVRTPRVRESSWMSLSDDYRGSDWSGYDTGKQLWEDFKSFTVDASRIAPLLNAFHRITSEGGNAGTRSITRRPMGFMPCVPAYLCGDPNNMFALDRVKKPVKVFKIFLNASSGGEASLKDIQRAGEVIIRAIAGIEKKGDRVELTMGWMESHRSNELNAMGVLVKRPTQPMNLTRIAWGALNPSFLRGICLGWAEAHPRADDGGSIWRGWNRQQRSAMSKVLDATVITVSELIYTIDSLGYDEKSLEKASAQLISNLYDGGL